MRCLLSAASFGISTGMFLVDEAPVTNQGQGDSISVPTASAQCLTNATVSKGSSVKGGKVTFSYMTAISDFEDIPNELCCELAGHSKFWTAMKYRPSKDHPGQFDYICTAYDGGEIVAGNDTTTAGSAPAPPPPPDYKCEQRATIDECIVPDEPKGFSNCAWHGGACHKGPPIECGNGRPSEMPFCLNIIVADHALPAGPAGRHLGSFNWTDGQITAGEPIVLMPTQVLKLGGSNWWSVGSGYVKNSTGGWDPNPFQVCVRYNELLQDGTADDNSWFAACASGPGYLNLNRGASSKITGQQFFGGSSREGESLWATFVFWSNETVGATFQV